MEKLPSGSPPPTVLSQTTKWLMAVELVATGLPDATICKEIGISRTTLYTYKRKEGFYDAVRDKHIIIFKDLVPKALRAIEESLDSYNGKVKLDAARIVLDRTIFPDFKDDEADTGTHLTQVNIQVNYE